jgi:ABC-type Fe3+ transport system permease subunit
MGEKPMKKNALENKIKVSGEQYFSQRTSHLTFNRTLTKSKPWWTKALIWGTPSAALVTSVTVLVAILIGATQPNGSIPQTFQTIQALIAALEEVAGHITLDQIFLVQQDQIQVTDM